MVEEYLLYSEFLKIKQEEDFVKVFPEAEKYIIDGTIFIPFAFAKIMLESPKKHCKLYGLQLLYQLFQDSKYKQLLMDKYEYNINSFDNDKQRFEIFDESGEFEKVNLKLTDQLDFTQKELYENKQQLEEYKTRLREIQESFFWRSTLPLQKIVRFLRRSLNV